MIILDINETYINYAYLIQGKLRYNDMSIRNKLNIFYPLAIYENDFEYITAYFSDGTKDRVYYLAYESYDDFHKSVIPFNNSLEKEKINIKKYGNESFKDLLEADTFMINLNNSFINNRLVQKE